MSTANPSPAPFKGQGSFTEEQTLNYYEANAASFAAQTVGADFSSTQNRFLSLLPKGGRILDFGCGAGRDAKAFHEAGFHVEAWDGSPSLCEIAKAYTGLPVKCRRFQELDVLCAFDGIWACSSILHLNRKGLREIFPKLSRALRQEGILYTSFKYGENEGPRGGRFFTDFTEESFASFLEMSWQLQLLEEWVNPDVRPGRKEEKWLNLLLKKASPHQSSF